MTTFTAICEVVMTVLWYIFFGCIFAMGAVIALAALINLFISNKED